MQIKIVNDLYVTPLSDLRAGQIGVDARGNIFARIYVPNPKETQTQVFQLDEMSDQYNDHIDVRTRVRILAPDEQVVLTI